MKNLELSAYGVEEMSDAQIQEANGGWLLAFVAGAVLGGMLYDLINNPAECGAAFNEGRAYARSL